MRKKRLPLLDVLIATIGERPMRFDDVTRSIANQGYAKVLIQDVRDDLQYLKRKRMVSEISQGFVSTRRFA
jgi:ribosomal protein L32E